VLLGGNTAVLTQVITLIKITQLKNKSDTFPLFQPKCYITLLNLQIISNNEL